MNVCIRLEKVMNYHANGINAPSPPRLWKNTFFGIFIEKENTIATTDLKKYIPLIFF